MSTQLAIDKELIRSILTLATAIEARDPYTGGHTWRVSQYARVLSEAVGFGTEGVFIVTMGGLLHDLGKIGIQDKILLKPGRLDELEYNQMKRHPQIGDDLVSQHPYYAILRDAVRFHHERYDGGGYPNGFDKNALSPIARVMAIADAFDAMTSTRAYRTGMPLEKALAILESEKNKQFDGAMVGSFIDLAERGKLNHILGHCADERMLLNCPGCGPVIAPKGDQSDGSEIHCPVCHGKYHMHQKGDDFELEYSGDVDMTVVPGPDVELVDHFLSQIPNQIEYGDYLDPLFRLSRKALQG